MEHLINILHPNIKSIRQFILLLYFMYFKKQSVIIIILILILILMRLYTLTFTESYTQNKEYDYKILMFLTEGLCDEAENCIKTIQNQGM